MHKFRVTFKTPDAVEEPCKEAGLREAHDRAQSLDRVVDEDELKELEGYWQKYFEGFASKWVSHGEYVTIEFDPDAGTATVVQKGG